MKTVTANNFEEFMAHVLTLEDFPIYRGLTDIDHAFIPRLGRADKAEIGRSFGGDIKEVEKTAVGQFKTASPPFLQRVPNNEWEWLCLMQHHGTPTRLMDWTLSPLVAGFFALRNSRNQKPTKPAVVYGIKCPDLLNLHAGVDPWTHTTVEFFPVPHISSRIAAQQSYLSFHPSPDAPYAAADLLQIVIPPGTQEKLAYTLERIGFRETTMFPGLDSINDGLRKALKL